MQVYILTFCRNADLLYGTTLVFKTLRTGFPTAAVTIVDNNSVPEVRPMLEELARVNGCTYWQLNAHDAVPPHTFLRRTIEREQARTVVFLDPDVIFWENCESWRFPGLLAGRLIPTFRDEFSGCITLPRLHTSFLWVPDVAALRHCLAELRRSRLDFYPFVPYMFRTGADWYRFDTAAALFAAIADEMVVFGQRELDAYDHLFCGSHIDLVMDSLQPSDRDEVLRLHHDARHDYTRLKGIWKLQEEYFKRRAVNHA